MVVVERVLIWISLNRQAEKVPVDSSLLRENRSLFKRLMKYSPRKSSVAK